MASLQKFKLREKNASTYICNNRKSFHSPKQLRSQKSTTSIPNGSSLHSSLKLESKRSTKDEAANIDEIAIRAIVSILSGYIGRYIKDETFRESTKEKCISCLVGERDNDWDDNGVLANMEKSIQCIDNLIQGNYNQKGTIRNDIFLHLSTIVASLNSSTPNSNLSSCANLYLSILYKIEKNDRLSSCHILQVFCDSPFFARTKLLPDLWDHFFLPHLLHLKVWYSQELEFLSGLEFQESERKRKAFLSKVYNEVLNKGTIQFSLYYKQWLKDGAKAPSLPLVPLPSSRPRYASSGRRRASDSYIPHSSLNSNLFQAVFGPNTLQRQSMDLVRRNLASTNTISHMEEGDNYSFVQRGDRSNRRSLSLENKSCPKSRLWTETQKPDHLFQFITCREVEQELISKNVSIRTESKTNLLPIDLSQALNVISSSDFLSECEIAIRIVTKAWLDSSGNSVVEAALSKPPIIEGMLEVLFSSQDDEILELVVSILAELVPKNEAIRQMVLNYDPQLEVFLRLLRSSSLFLKASILLYLAKPKAKQMISPEWVPLVLRVLEFGDQLQTLFTIRCSCQVAALYLLDQLLTGFEEDRNVENAIQLVSVGGLSIVLKRMEKGEINEREDLVLIILYCIQADERCRNYVAENLNKGSLLELIVCESHKGSKKFAFNLLAEVLCLNRRRSIEEFLTGLKEGWGGLNTMNILLVYLQKALLEEKPSVASILLQLDLMGDPVRFSVYREEAIETIISSLDCRICCEKVQENTARALLMLGGCFSFSGEAITKTWLLQKAGFNISSNDEFHTNNVFLEQSDEDEEELETWQQKVASVLYRSGSERLMVALSTSMASGLPSLSKASLVTVSWISRFLQLVKDETLRSKACSILAPQLIEFLNYDKDAEDRVLASYSLFNLLKSCPESISMISLSDVLLDRLQKLSPMTWTTNEATSIILGRFHKNES